jgi:hypothetical protein
VPRVDLEQEIEFEDTDLCFVGSITPDIEAGDVALPVDSGGVNQSIESIS